MIFIKHPKLEQSGETYVYRLELDSGKVTKTRCENSQLKDYDMYCDNEQYADEITYIPSDHNGVVNGLKWVSKMKEEVQGWALCYHPHDGDHHDSLGLALKAFSKFEKQLILDYNDLLRLSKITKAEKEKDSLKDDLQAMRVIMERMIDKI